MRVKSKLELIFTSENDAQIFYQAFLPDLNAIPMKRSKIELDPPNHSSNSVYFSIDADDGIAYRATINSLIQFANIVDQTLSQVTK
jgi:tRNA threonylcarbamoyladenosine modification (KEOPS) complex  Pcc1 subunit